MEQKVVVAGWGQITQPKEFDGIALDPMGLMQKPSKKAAEMMASKKILADLDGIMVVKTLSHH